LFGSLQRNCRVQEFFNIPREIKERFNLMFVPIPITSFATILKVTAALGIKLHAQPLHAGQK
jgi:hypothetical protein